ncbi:MAG: hypothetical protein LBR85_09140 [Oscillospiraceae bacterium]|jgi:hypothetical protein|nr:hypothetical protein [Oscillospiraceae bacterium]
MSAEVAFTKENLNTYLKELAKEFRKLNGTVMPAEIILIGGASMLANYGFRELTYDIDAVIMASSVMKEAINRVGDKLGLPNGWLNTDFKATTSYSERLAEVSVYYRTFSNIVTVRTVAAEYLIAMKLMSGRPYKYDLSDVAGILWEHEKNGHPISQADIDKAVATLYGSSPIPMASKKYLEDIFADGDYERIYNDAKGKEQEAKEILLDFDKRYPNTIRRENIASILEHARKSQSGTSIKERLGAAKAKADIINSARSTESKTVKKNSREL